jgi:hypothetical protein
VGVGTGLRGRTARRLPCSTGNRPLAADTGPAGEYARCDRMPTAPDGLVPCRGLELNGTAHAPSRLTRSYVTLRAEWAAELGKCPNHTALSGH